MQVELTPEDLDIILGLLDQCTTTGSAPRRMVTVLEDKLIGYKTDNTPNENTVGEQYEVIGGNISRFP